MTPPSLPEPYKMYQLDDEGRIRPLHQVGWVKERWRSVATFDDAISEIASLDITLADAFPDDDWHGLSDEEWLELCAKRHLNIEEGFFMITGVDVDCAVFRFQFGDEVFFNLRPDFAFLSLKSNLGEPPVNAVEAAVRSLMLAHYALQAGALKRAIDCKELSATGLYPIEWWLEFWSVRGFGGTLPEAKEAPLAGPTKEKPTKRQEATYLTIIGALLELVRSPRPGRDSNAAVIRELTENYGDKPGISKSNLEAKFAAAQRQLSSL